MVQIARETQLDEYKLDKIYENQILIARKALSMGADMILETDDYAFNTGPLISPAAFDALFAPRLTRYVDAIHEAGGYMIKHYRQTAPLNCRYWDRRLPIHRSYCGYGFGSV